MSELAKTYRKLSVRLRSISWISLLALATQTPLAFGALGEAFFLPPHADYQRSTSEHFEVVFPNAYDQEAKQTLNHLEQAHATLAPYFNYAPNHRTTVIIIDNEDSANGATSAVGLQGLILFMARPEPYSSIGEYDDWLKNLIIHEYAHYLTLEQTRGFFKGLRYVFGNLVFPNHFWPTWLAEGWAVHAESTFTTQGRGYGTYYTTLTRDGLFRSKLGETNWLAYNKLMGPVPDFPFGESYYYAGYGIVDELLATYGKDVGLRYPTKSAGRVPYFLDGGVKGLGEPRLGFRELWEQWIRRQQRALQPELNWLKTNGSQDPVFLTEQAISTKGSRISHNGRHVAYVLNSGHESASVQIVDTQTRETKKLDDAISGVGLSWSADDQKLFYAKTDFNGPFAFYSDLFEYDFTTKNITRLTSGARAKDPDVCGKNKLVFATQRGRFSEIQMVTLGDGVEPELRTLYRAKENHHVANPRCTPDFKTVYFSEHGTSPLDFVSSVDIQTGEHSILFGGSSPQQKGSFGAIFPHPANNGDVYFTRVKDGYYDLARWKKNTKTVEVVARSSGGYWLPSLNSTGDQLAVSYVSATGIRTALMPTESTTGHLSGIDKAPVTRPVAAKLQASPLPTIEAQTRGYNLLTSLAPRIWSPYFVVGSDEARYGATVMGWDDTDQLSYSLLALYDQKLKRPAGSLNTRHRISTLQLGVLAESMPESTYWSLGIYGQQHTLGLSIARPIPSAFYFITPAIIAQWSRTQYQTPVGTFFTDPELHLGAELNYDGLRSYAHSIAEEEGASARLAARRIFTRKSRTWKALGMWEQLIASYPRHSAFDVTGYLAWAPAPRHEIAESAVKLGGQGEPGDLNPPLRGYRLSAIQAKRAAVVQSEYRVPMADFFSGLGNWPFFFRNLGAFAFYDGTKVAYADSGAVSPWISGAGAGLLLNMAVGYQAPLQLRLEYAHGFKRNQGGDDTVSLLFKL